VLVGSPVGGASGEMGEMSPRLWCMLFGLTNMAWHVSKHDTGSRGIGVLFFVLRLAGHLG
jgi:hypothetical protein